MIVFWYVLATVWTVFGVMSDGVESAIFFCIATVLAVGAKILEEIRKC